MTVLPNDGEHIVFSKLPNGSYASVGKVYLVSRPERNRVHLENIGPSGGRTSDSALMYRGAVWSRA